MVVLKEAECVVFEEEEDVLAILPEKSPKVCIFTASSLTTLCRALILGSYPQNSFAACCNPLWTVTWWLLLFADAH